MVSCDTVQPVDVTDWLMTLAGGGGGLIGVSSSHTNATALSVFRSSFIILFEVDGTVA
jgi:hypothetical protein